MDDLISRQAAIEYYKRIIDATDTDGKYNLGFVDGLEFCINHLSTMPSAQPERKKGKWIDIGDYCICNQCGHTEQQFNGVEQIPLHTPFCAMCGADMRDENDNIPMEYYENGGI